MMRKILFPVFMLMMIIGMGACNHNKIACPTYKDSFPEANSKKKAKPGDDKPQLPKVTRSTSVNMGPGK